MTVHSFAHSKLPQQNMMMNDVRLFSRILVLGNSMRIDNRQSIQLCPPHTRKKNKFHCEAAHTEIDTTAEHVHCKRFYQDSCIQPVAMTFISILFIY